MRISMQRVALPVVLATIFSIFGAREIARRSQSSLDRVIQPNAAAASAGPLLPSDGQSGPRKFALLVGINHYKDPDIPALEGSINDVEEMRQLLIEKFEFPPENIVTLTDSAATHAAIISQIQTHLIGKAQPGDIIVFHYSGHGSQMPDVTGKMNNGMDETIVPYDSRVPGGKVFDISGAELHPLLQQLAIKTKNVTFVLDSCHSGTLVRGARVRGLEADTRTPPPLPAYAISATRGVEVGAENVSPKFATIAAATSKETAFEHFADGKDHGALTYFLVRQLRSATAGVTYRDIMDNVSGDVTAYYPSQHVSLEGAEADQYVFGDGSSLARAYVTASPSLLTPHGVTLTVGQVQDATVGSTYDIYPPGSKKFAPPEKPVARIRLASVSDLTSEATFISGGPILPASRAVEREHQYGKSRMRVFLDHAESSTALQSIRTALQPLTSIEFVQTPSMCNLQLRETAGKVQILGADESPLSPPVETGDPGAVDHVVSQVKSWAKWFSVLSISNPHSEIELQFTLGAGQTRDPMARVGKPDMGVWQGEKVDATLTNNGSGDVYVAMLDLSSDGSVSVVYPAEQGAKEVLQSGKTHTDSLTTCVRKGQPAATDILKVFASYQPIDLRPLTQGAIRDIPEEPLDPLQGLLAESSGGTRGVLIRPADLGTWTSVQRVLVVKHRAGAADCQ